MVMGFGEGPAERIEHFRVLRELQDSSIQSGHSGFNAFIAWPLQTNENTSMEEADTEPITNLAQVSI